jgi:hypothetical protein
MNVSIPHIPPLPKQEKLQQRRRFLLGFVISILVLLPFYAITLQTIPNGSDEPPMIDVGETQVVLNVWGTLHATGYPLYVMSSAALVGVLKAIGGSAAAAPAVTSLLWGMVALASIYTLAAHLTRRVMPASMMVVLLGLTRSVWLHHAIAEIYTFGLLITALLLLLALWKREIRGRIYWLALIGGFGVGHHRAILMIAPALLYAAWPTLRRSKLPRVISLSIVLGVIGLLPYAYLPLRANADALWVYGEPGTLSGLWDQFIGREASRFIGATSSLIENFNRVNVALLADLTAPGLLIGSIGLALATRTLRHRRAAITFLIAGGVSYIFHVLFYSDILAALILQITLSLAFGWLFIMDWLLVRAVQTTKTRDFQFQIPVWVQGYVLGVVTLFGLLLIAQNILYIRGMTYDGTGIQTIEAVKQIEPGSTLMIPWGTRHFAAGFARDVLGELPDVTLIDHKVEMLSPLITLPETFYSYPVDWWQERFGQPVYLTSTQPGLVRIDTQMERIDHSAAGVSVVEQAVSCSPERWILQVAWASAEKPAHDLSVFVHLLDEDGNILAQADQTAPVYGWRPMTSWQAEEIVRDVYALPRNEKATLIRYGLYRQLDSGSFQNEYEYETAPACD